MRKILIMSLMVICMIFNITACGVKSNNTSKSPLRQTKDMAENVYDAIKNHDSEQLKEQFCERLQPGKETGVDKIYEYIDYAIRTPGDKPHFFELNFYLNNRVHNFYNEKPQSGFLVITHSDYMMCVDGFKKQGYKFKFIKNWAEFDMDLYQFNK